MEFIKSIVKKHSRTIVIINMILLTLSIGFGNSTILNGIVIFLLLRLLLFMPEEAFKELFDDEEDKK